MNQFEDILRSYLTKESDYAILLNGNWGIGKTFYYESVLLNIIKTTNTIKNASKKYQPIYISLFGIKSIDEIQTKIVYDLYAQKVFGRHSKSSKLKIAKNLGSILLNGFLNFKQLGNSSEYKTYFSDIGDASLNSYELFICFDDLERKSDLLLWKDLTGYINSLVEQGVKVMLIANEDKVDGDYVNYREKIIGLSLSYKPNIKSLIAHLLSFKYEKSYSCYYKFLVAHLNILFKAYNGAEGNLRHLTYALDCFHNVYSRLKNDVIDINKDWSSKLDEELENVFTFCVSISVEFRKNKINSENKNIYADELFGGDISWYMSDKDQRGDRPKNALDLLKENYYLGTYYYYESIFDYVMGMQIFDLPNFEAEFKKIYKLNKKAIDPLYEELEQLRSDEAYNFTIAKYSELVKLVRKKATTGEYKLEDYLGVYYRLVNYDNILSFDLEELLKDLKVGIDIRAQKSEYNPVGFGHHRWATFGETKKIEEKLLAYLKEVNEQLKNNKESYKYTQIINDMWSNPKGFLDEYFSFIPQYQSGDIVLTPFWNMVNSDTFCEHITCIWRNSEIKDFRGYFDRRYLDRSSYVSYYGIQEREFLILLDEKLDLFIRKNKIDIDPMKMWFLKDFEDTIKKSETAIAARFGLSSGESDTIPLSV